MRERLHDFDLVLTKYITSWPTWLTSPFHVITFFGQPIVTMGVGVILAVIALGRMNYRLFFAAVAAMATLGIGTLIKITLQRERPVTEYVAGMLFKSFSFPSGHALGSTVVFGLVAYLAFQHLPQPLGIVVASFLVLLIIAIGVSRVYLGAHFPTDVIAGWVLGCIALWLIIIFIKPSL